MRFTHALFVLPYFSRMEPLRNAYLAVATAISSERMARTRSVARELPCARPVSAPIAANITTMASVVTDVFDRLFFMRFSSKRTVAESRAGIYREEQRW